MISGSPLSDTLSRYFQFLIPITWLLLACSTAGSQPGQTPPAAAGSPPPFNRSLLVVIGTSDSAHTAFLRSWTQNLSSRGRRMEIRVKTDREWTETDLLSGPLMFIGNPKTNTGMTQIVDKLPVLFAPDYFSLGQATYQGKGYVCVLSSFSPPGASHPISLITANNDEDIRYFLEKASFGGRFGPPGGQWGYQVFKDNKRIRLGNFTEKGTPDGNPHWDFSDESTPRLTSAHLRLFVHSDTIAETTVNNLMARCEKNLENLQKFTGIIPNITLDYHIYGSAQNQGLITERMEQSFALTESAEIHTLLNDDYKGNFEATETRIFFRQFYGQPQVLALEEGLSVWFSPQWQKKGYAYWSSRLFESNNLLSLVQLTDNEYFQQESPLIRGALAGSFVDFLVELWGKESFLKKYPTWTPALEELQSLELAWQTYHQNHPIPAQPPVYAEAEYQKGMTFAHEGYGIYNGYGSEMAHESLSRLQSLGTNAISLIPYTGTREVKTPSTFGFSQFAGGENDASVVHAFHAARRMGMKTMLKPQVWVRGGWPGDLEMQNEADWQRFFTEYRRWIRHYAMLAEIHEMDIFCVGVEFVKATITHPEEWRTLIKDIRQIYHGPITYAANWGEEFEKLAFAESLDFIGLDCYYPLSDKTTASKAELRAGFRKIADNIRKVSEKHNKPIVFTEVGFRSIESPWIQPHAEAGDSPYEETDQALCYQIVLETLKDQPWFLGLYWWKWPSYLDHTHRDPTDYNPCGKEAEEVLKVFY
ncbi:MAG: glycoside hydrolase TIM-barrel-like domain-containing protein [Bacteroidia bacterium]|nr:glycoside hydrolase TIM-barrel-like domain-containing protein [Bacteroidia bacterium]